MRMGGSLPVLSSVALVTVLAAGCGRAPEPEQPQRAPSTRSAAPVEAVKSRAAESTPADDRPAIVAFGNSLTAGMGVDPALSYPAVLQRELNARGYKYRVIMGPSYRADMWAQTELSPEISASELARSCYGSFATAWKVIQDRKLLAA